MRVGPVLGHSAELELYFGYIKDCLATKICLHVSESTTWGFEELPCAAPVPGAITVSTSGTTGDSKQVFGLLAEKIRKNSGANFSRVWLCCFAIDKWAGISLIAFALQGGEAVSIPEELTAREVLRCISDDLVTNVNLTPSLFRRLALGHDQISEGLKSIVSVTLGGEYASQSTLDLVRAICPSARITHVYATTETGEVFASSDGIEGFDSNKVLSNPKLELSETGELFVEGFNTGDRWVIVGDRLKFSGRSGSFIKVGGQKVLPSEIEEVAMSVPGVNLAKVYPKENALLGHVLIMEFEGTIDEASLRLGLNKMLPKYKVPRLINKVELIELSKAGKR